MQACQDYARFGIQVVSPHLKYDEKEFDNDDDDSDQKDLSSKDVQATVAAAEEFERDMEKRKQWKKWSAEINKEGKEDNNKSGGLWP